MYLSLHLTLFRFCCICSAWYKNVETYIHISINTHICLCMYMYYIYVQIYMIVYTYITSLRHVYIVSKLQLSGSAIVKFCFVCDFFFICCFSRLPAEGCFKLIFAAKEILWLNHTYLIKIVTSLPSILFQITHVNQ